MTTNEKKHNVQNTDVNKPKPKTRFTRLKKILMDKGLSQKELSRLSSVPEYKISLLASGRVNNIFLITAKKICEVLEVSLDDAFGDVPSK